MKYLFIELRGFLPVSGRSTDMPGSFYCVRYQTEWLHRIIAFTLDWRRLLSHHSIDNSQLFLKLYINVLKYDICSLESLFSILGSPASIAFSHRVVFSAVKKCKILFMKACCAWSTPQSEIFFNLVAVMILQVWWVYKHFPAKVSFFLQYRSCIIGRPFVCLFVDFCFWKDVCLCSPIGQKREQKRDYDTLRNLLRTYWEGRCV